jgi:hypothetical protein
VHCVLIEWHPMIGVDLHTEAPLPPAPPTPVPMWPHFSAALLHHVMKPSMSANVQALGACAMQRGTDIMSFIPHLPIPPAPNCMLLAPIMAFSASKSYFGPAAVEVSGKPVAVALASRRRLRRANGDRFLELAR